MIYKILKFLLPVERSNLEVLLSKIDSQKEVRSANIVMSLNGTLSKIDVSKDLHFMVGTKKRWPYLMFDYFIVRFDNDDKKCTVTLDYGDEALFAFNDPKEVSQIREAIINKYNKMIQDEIDQKHRDFKDL